MQVIKQIGFIIISFGFVLGLYQGYLLILNYLYDYSIVYDFIIAIRPILLLVMLLGFFLIVFGGSFEKLFSKRDEPQPGPRPKKSVVRNRVYVISALIGVAIIIPLIFIILTHSDLFVPHEVRVTVDVLSLAAIVWLATSLPLYVDKINRDTLEINFSGHVHVHETFLGIIFIVTGFIFIFHHVLPFDFVFGSYYLIIGSFLMGRDIEDLRQFKIIEIYRKKKPALGEKRNPNNEI
jgi:hypothetical protein